MNNGPKWITDTNGGAIGMSDNLQYFGPMFREGLEKKECVGIWNTPDYC